MVKILLIISLIPLVTALSLRLLFYRPVKELEGKKAQLNTLKLCKEISQSEVEVETGKTLNVKEGRITLQVDLAESRDIKQQIEVMMPVGLMLLAKGKTKGYKQHSSLVYFDILFSTFSFIAIFFGCLAKTIPLTLGVMFFFLVLGICSINNLYLTWLRHQATALILSKIKKLPLYTKDDDISLVEKELKSNTFKYITPKFISWTL